MRSLFVRPNPLAFEEPTTPSSRLQARDNDPLQNGGEYLSEVVHGHSQLHPPLVVPISTTRLATHETILSHPD